MGKQQANNNNIFNNNKNNNNNKVQTQKETSHSQKEGISKHIEQVVKTREGNEASSVKEDGKQKKQNSKITLTKSFCNRESNLATNLIKTERNKCL